MAGQCRTTPATCASSEFLACDDIGIRTGEEVVFGGTNWTWRAGEQWAILGPDGAGQDILIKAILGQVPLAHGEVRGPHGAAGGPEAVPEEAIALVGPEVQRALVTAESSYYQSRWHSGLQEGARTVAQFLSQDSVEERNPFEIRPQRGDRGAFQRQRRRFIDWLGIQGLMRRRLVHLSNGELRKTLLVHALLRAPRLLILEDPFAGLDVATRRKLGGVITRLMRSGWPVLVTTQRVDEIPAPTTHLLIIDSLRVAARGAKAEMLQLWRQRFCAGAPRSIGGAARAARPRPKWEQAKAPLRVPSFLHGELRPALAAPLVELLGVTVAGGQKRLLRDVTWTLRQGECWALLGPNGAGKTTLLNLIQGDHPQAYSQNVRLFGRSTESTQTLWQSRQRLGWMSPELHQHYPGFWTVVDVVSSGFYNTLGLYQPCSRAQRAAAMAWLRDLGLAGQARAAFGELSFGQQRLVLLARAAVKEPQLLILDEPCQGLDAAQCWRVLSVVDRVTARANSSLIFVTHHAQELPGCITHVLRLAAGRIQSAKPLRRNQTQIYEQSRPSPAD